VKIDKILPDTTHSFSPLEPTGDNDWYTTNVHVVLHAYDGSSGVDVTTYRLNEGDWQTYAGEFIVAQEGHLDIEYYSIDNASNAEAPKNFSLKIDKTPPDTEYVRTPSAPDGESGWYTTNVTLTLTPRDAHSGVHTTSYKVDNETWKTYASPRVLTREGAQTFTFYSVDAAGNMEPYHTRTIKIDRTPPVASILHPAEGTLYLFGRAILPALGGRILILGGITVEVNATDAVSGLTRVEFFVDDTFLDNDSTSPYTWDLTRLVGRHVLMVKAYDTAGYVTTRELTVTIFSFF
jgi:hypothetical protein